MSELVIFMCPPYPEYKEAPEDQPNSELFDCPKCTGKMWLSGKKKGALLFASGLQKEIFLGCYTCVRRFAEENAAMFQNAEKIVGVEL